MTNGEAPAGMGISWEFVRDFTKLMHEVSRPSLSPGFGSFGIYDVDVLRF